MMRSIIAAVLAFALVNPAWAEPNTCSADWQCPHGTTCQAGHCGPAPAGPGSPGTGGGANGGGANGGGANGGGANGGGGANAGGANGGGANGGGGANAGGGNAGGANAGGGNAGGGNAGGGNAGGGNAGGGNAGGGNAGGGNAGGGNAGGGNAGGPNAGGPSAGGGTPYGGGAPGPGGPYGTPGEPFSIQLVVSGGTNDIADNAHALYKPGSTLKLSVIARDAHGNVVSGCEPEFEIADNSGADGLARGALKGNEVTFLREGKFSISAFCKNNPKISTHGQTNSFNFETSINRFASCTTECCRPPGPSTCNIGSLEEAAKAPEKSDTPKHASGPSPGVVIGGIALLAVIAYGTYVLASGAAGGGNYCFQITSSDNGSCPADSYCAPSESDCETYLAQTMAICQCHVAQCTVNFSGCSASGRVAPHDVPRDVNTLVAQGFATQRRGTARLAPQTSTHHSNTGTLVIGAALGAAALATTTYVIWRQAHPKHSGVEILPWASPDAAGVMAMGQF